MYAENVEECKRVCLNNVSCAAVHYDDKMGACYVRDQQDMEAYNRKTSHCCDHYHKTYCKSNKLGSHRRDPMSNVYICQIPMINVQC